MPGDADALGRLLGQLERRVGELERSFGSRIYPPRTSSLPAATALLRGTILYVEGGVGVADRLVVCRKSSADVYAWVDLF